MQSIPSPSTSECRSKIPVKTSKLPRTAFWCRWVTGVKGLGGDGARACTEQYRLTAQPGTPAHGAGLVARRGALGSPR